MSPLCPSRRENSSIGTQADRGICREYGKGQRGIGSRERERRGQQAGQGSADTSLREVSGQPRAEEWGREGEVEMGVCVSLQRVAERKGSPEGAGLGVLR